MIQNKNTINCINRNEFAHGAVAKLGLQASVLLVAGVVMLTGVGHGLETLGNHETDKKQGTDGTTSNTGNGSNESRTPREETGPHYTSYGSFSRTPARSGAF